MPVPVYCIFNTV